MSESNDADEGKYIASVFSDLCDEQDILPDIRDIAKILAFSFQSTTEGFGLCLSEEGDLLSQWRAYASDGTGFSIGFCKQSMELEYDEIEFGRSFFELKKISYGRKPLEIWLKPFVNSIRELSEEYGVFVKLKPGLTIENAIRRFESRSTPIGEIFLGQCDDAHVKMMVMMGLMKDMHFRIYDFKTESFFEEKEYRVMRYRQREHFLEIKYAQVRDKITPYIECFLRGEARKAVVEVVVGPKNKSNIDWVRAFLVASGFEHVQVRRSTHTGLR